MLVFAALAQRGSRAVEIEVEARGHAGDGWSVSGAGCRAYGGTCEPVEYDDIHAGVGDALVFKFGRYHDVFLSSLAEKNCDFTSGRSIADGGSGGGAGFTYLLAEPGTFVFSCTRSGNRPGWPAIGSHCASGQVVRVVVSDGGVASAEPAPSETPPCDLDGTWSTTYSEVQLRGSEGSYLGVWGALSEVEWAGPNVAVGRFRNDEVGREGYFSWTIADECGAFTGQWGWGTAGDDPVSGRWDGHRVSVSAPMAADALGSAAAAGELSEAPPPGFVGPFSGMGISGFNDLGHAPAFSPSECASRCASLTACSSFDWGARGEVRGECWLSTADRGSAGHAYVSWPLYDYYEKQQAAAAAAAAAATVGRPASAAAAGSTAGHAAAAAGTTLPLPPLVVAILAVLCSALLLTLGCLLQRARRPTRSDVVVPAAVLVQAAHVQHTPHALNGEVVSLCPLPAGYATGGGRDCSYPVVVAEEAKGGGDDATAATAGGGGGGHQVAAQPALARAIP